MTAPIIMLAIDLTKGSFPVCANGADGTTTAKSTAGGIAPRPTARDPEPHHRGRAR